MGDLESILNRLHFSDVNTLLLVILVLVLKSLFKRIDDLEQIATKNRASVAFIKGRLDIYEDDDI